MDLQLANKRALVTGSTAGIGFATARALAQEGAEVIVNGRSRAGVADAVARLRLPPEDVASHMEALLERQVAEAQPGRPAEFGRRKPLGGEQQLLA